ncbi:MAG: hypothetical protein HY556_08525 [Euryarchaeota archaeon]|nr:hypothetical protein [Euryarchaeota archaeon]
METTADHLGEKTVARESTRAWTYIVWGMALSLIHLSYALSTVTGPDPFPLPFLWAPAFIVATLLSFGLELGRQGRPQMRRPSSVKMGLIAGTTAGLAFILLGYAVGFQTFGAIPTAIVAGFLIGVDRSAPDAGRSWYAKGNLATAASLLALRVDPLYAGAVMALTSGIGLLMLGAYKLNLNVAAEGEPP